MKKTLFKKTAVLAVVLTLAVSVFAGCAGSPAATEPQPTTQNQVETTAESTSNTQTTGEISLEEAKTIALEYVEYHPQIQISTRLSLTMEFMKSNLSTTALNTRLM